MSEPRAFLAKFPGVCVDAGDDCRGIQVGDKIVKRPQPALFDQLWVAQTKTGSMYREMWYSHEACYLAAEKRRGEHPPRILP